MGSCLRVAGACAALVLAAALALGGDGHDGQLPKTPAEALEWSKGLIDAARGAKSAETPEIAKGIRRAVDWMQPFVSKGSADDAWAAAWNEALTLSRFHKNKPTADYAMDARNVAQWISIKLPKGRRWSLGAGETPKLQQRGGVQRSAADGRIVASISVCVYSFNVVYSGVGGENATGLAKALMDIDKGRFEKVDSASGSVTARALSKGFSRAQFYEITGKLKEGGAARLRSYYSKGATRTYAFDVLEFRAPVAEDSPCEAWQSGVEDPELEAVLASIEEEDEKKK